MNRQSAGNQKDEIIKFYLYTNNIVETAKEFNVSYETIRTILRKNGFVSNKKKPVNSNNLHKDFFVQIDNSIKAYFAGFFKADGYVDKTRNRFAIRIHEQDIEILYRFCDAVNLDRKRINTLKQHNSDKTYVEIAITNEEFIAPILDIKFETFLNKIPNEFCYDFIRGYFDGDGCIAYNNPKKLKFQMNIMGNPSDDHMLKYIQRYFDIPMFLDKRSNLPFLKSGSRSTIFDFADKVYKSANLYLTRKKQKFDLFRYLFELTSTTTRETPLLKGEDIV
jgi:intein-encoded DNA endonuclease-like protein